MNQNNDSTRKCSVFCQAYDCAAKACKVEGYREPMDLGSPCVIEEDTDFKTYNEHVVTYSSIHPTN